MKNEIIPSVRLKSIPGFEPYMITEDGRVWNSKHKRWLNARLDDRGRPRISLWINGKHVQKRIHQFILLAYVGPCPEGKEACHKDGDQQNNRLDNLYYGTHSENMFDAVRHGTHQCVGRVGERAYHSKLSNEDRRMIIYMYSTGLFIQSEIAKLYKISQTQIGRIVRGEVYPFCTAIKKAG
jgi:hypothetical protein